MTREQFIGKIENWDNYKPFLWSALQATNGNVIEMGVGKGSTKILHEFCKFNNRMLWSYEYDFEWFKKFKHLKTDWHDVIYVDGDWDQVDRQHNNVTVLFIDHSPGERRKVDIKIFANKADIIVIHDTESSMDYGYGMREEINKFKYIKDDKFLNGAWTTMCSNFIDVNLL